MIRVERSHFHLTWLGIFMQNRQTSARAINHFGAVAHSDKVSTGKKMIFRPSEAAREATFDTERMNQIECMTPERKHFLQLF